MQVDNTTADGFANSTMKQKRSKAMDMRWYWLQDRVRQNQFLVYFRPGKDNLADPFTKHHTPTHIQEMKPKFVHTNATACLALPINSHLMRGCVIPAGVRPSPVRTCLPKRASQGVRTANNNIVIAPVPHRMNWNDMNNNRGVH